MAETEFLSDVVTDGMVEEELGRLAAEKASSDEVRRLGKYVMNARSEVGKGAAELAASKGIAVPGELNGDYRALIASLASRGALDFDRECLNTMLEEHERTVSQLMQDVEGISDPDVRSFAERAFETVEEHFDAVRRVAAGLR
jgi:putative membrane protein